MPASEGLEHPAPASLPGASSIFLSSWQCHASCQAQRARHAPSPGPPTALPAACLAPSRSREYGTGPGERSMASANGELRAPGAGMVPGDEPLPPPWWASRGNWPTPHPQSLLGGSWGSSCSLPPPLVLRKWRQLEVPLGQLETGVGGPMPETEGQWPSEWPEASSCQRTVRSGVGLALLCHLHLPPGALSHQGLSVCPPHTQGPRADP